MTRPKRAPLALVLIPTLVMTTALATAAGPGDDEAKAIAVKVTTAGAAMFDARDAKGLAATYQQDARLDVISRDKETGVLKTESRTGRAEIQAYYEELFKNEGAGHSRNTVEHARRIEPDLLLITGIFEPNTESAEPLKLPFVQTRQKEGESWRIVNLQLYVISQK